MDAEAKKSVIRTFFDSFGANDPEKALACLEDSAIWRVMGREGGLPISGEMDKETVRGLIGVVAEALKDGMKLTYNAWTIEGDRVALEMVSHGEKQDGTIYNNHYHFLVEFADDKISALREYGDTYHIWRVFMQEG